MSSSSLGRARRRSFKLGKGKSLFEKLASPGMAGARELDLRGLGLKQVPEAEILLHADTLEKLDLSNNELSDLPASFKSLNNLKILFCSFNKFTKLPAVVGQMPSLFMLAFRDNLITEIPENSLSSTIGWLILTNNKLRTLPRSIGRLTNLRKLMLSGNQLRSLPPEMSQCRQLELVRLASNRLAVPPAWLAELPRLAWVALAGNSPEEGWVAVGASAAPAATVPATAAPPPGRVIPWEELRVEEAALGDGTSGRVHRAEWTPPGAAAPRPVAVKVFKGAAGSDGAPGDEAAAALACGPHPHLVGALGRVGGHPAGGERLVLRLVPAHFAPLGAPPSLATVTRDTFPAPRAHLTARAALEALRGVAAGLEFLHAQGLAHGDVYAHNVLLDARTGEAVLADFGAAFPYLKEAGAPDYQALEVRAFGLLVEDVLGLLGGAAAAGAAGRRLAELAARCAGRPAPRRPTFAAARALLAELCAGEARAARRRRGAVGAAAVAAAVAGVAVAAGLWAA